MQSRVLDLNVIVRASVRIMGRLAGETINVVEKCNDQSLSVEADAGMLDQVLLNLCVNARDAMPDGGTLTVSTRSVAFNNENTPRNPDASPGKYAAVEVRDSGEGMSPEVCEHAFDPFFTTKDVGKGTGLGLSTAYGILTQHGGWIDLNSTPGQGATFTLYLPLTTALPAHSNTAPEADDSARGTETILVVEDEEPVRQTVRRALRHYGYKVLEAEDGIAAEALWREESEKVDLILTDLVMPHGITGMELGRRLKHSRPDLKIIYMTGHSQDLVEHGDKLTAGIDFLPKPFENRDLIRLIRDRLDNHQATASN